MTETKRLVEHFFRHEYANLVSVLTRAFGIARLDLVEDMVGQAMLQAMNSWKQNGIPDKPAGWIHKVARNRIIDELRREKNSEKAIAFTCLLNQDKTMSSWLAFEQLDESELSDNLLRMMFVCCHPSLDRRSQIAITLKILCGFSVSEIASGLLISDEAAKKRIQRAKRQLSQIQLPVELPAKRELPERLRVVHDVLYLMFNEGYSPSRGQNPIRNDICEEAARLCFLLCEHDTFSTPNSRALLALMLFHAARLDARTDAMGNAILLEDQNREKWDQGLIKIAHRWLVGSVKEEPSKYHYEAVLAQTHCAAISFEQTDWPTIIRLYDRLIEQYPSPLYQLNRAIAIGQNGDSVTALEQLKNLKNSGELKDYFLIDCALGHLYALQGDLQQATDCYLAALSFDLADHQRDLIKKKLLQLSEND